MIERTGPNRGPRLAGAALLTLLAALASASPLAAQTDYYNLDHDRPLRVEDAYATERYAIEFQLAPLELAGRRGGGVAYSPALELKYGILPGVEASAGVTPSFAWNNGNRTRGDTELEFSTLVNLNTETLRLPALGVRATAHVPVEGDHGATVELRGILTRTLFGPVRAHLNGATVLGDGARDDWWAGAALDYVLPFQATLLLAETWVAQPADGGDLGVSSTVGVRRQLTPSLGFDAGLGRDWSGAFRDDWRITLGLTQMLGARALMPIR